MLSQVELGSSGSSQGALAADASPRPFGLATPHPMADLVAQGVFETFSFDRTVSTDFLELFVGCAVVGEELLGVATPAVTGCHPVLCVFWVGPHIVVLYRHNDSFL